ncbi:MAG: hypothetical protein AABY13_04330 [Nanoarchaeota archaeon]
MSRFSYSLDIGEELEREKEVKRKLAQSRERSEDEEEKVRLDPKFEQEILALAEDQPVVQEDDSIVITPAKVEKPRPIASEVRVPKKAPVEPRPEPKLEKAKPEPKTEPAPKPVPKSEPKPKQLKESPKVVVKEPVKEVKPAKKVSEKKTQDKSQEATSKKTVVVPVPSVAPAPTPEPKPLQVEPRTPGDGTGRLVVALLLISIIAVVLIYTGLASEQAATQVSCYQQWASENKISLVSLDNLTGARQYWFKRALLADNEAEAAALMRMALCDGKEVTQNSNPLEFTRCAPDHLFAIDEDDVRAVANISVSSSCDALGAVITCDNGYMVDGLVAFGADGPPKYFIAKSGGAYTIVASGNKTKNEALTVLSDREGTFVAFTLPVQNREMMVMKFFVGDEFTSFRRAYLDHADGGERTLVYALV